MANNTTILFLRPSNLNNETTFDKFPFYEAHLPLLITIAFLSPVAVVANVLVLAAIWRNMSLRTTSYILLAGLAFTDFCTGLISQPFWIANELFYLRNPQLDILQEEKWPTFYVITRGIGDRCNIYFYEITILLITLMSIERWLIMSRRSLLTVRRVSMILGGLHLLMPLSVISIHGKETDLTIIFLMLFCVSVTSVAYFKVFRIIRRHQQQIQSSQNAAQPAINFEKYKKSVFTILYILAVLYIGYVPSLITIFLMQLQLASFDLSYLLINISVSLVFMSSTVNPLIVLWRMKDIRDEVIKLLKLIVCKNNQV